MELKGMVADPQTGMLREVTVEFPLSGYRHMMSGYAYAACGIRMTIKKERNGDSTLRSEA